MDSILPGILIPKRPMGQGTRTPGEQDNHEIQDQESSLYRFQEQPKCSRSLSGQKK
jgi:hypothetical protein